jgi:AraC family transcriptional activator of pobA
MKKTRVNPNSFPRQIKHYELYGELEFDSLASTHDQSWTNSFHFEKIPLRSSHYKWEIEPHIHDAFLQILMLSQGSAEVTVNGTITYLQSPCLIVVPAQNVHGFKFSQDIDGPIITVAQKPMESIARQLMPELAQVLHEPWLIRLGIDSKADAALTSLMVSIEHEWRIHSYGHAAAGLSLLMTLLIHIGRLTKTSSPTTSLMTVSRSAATIEKFKALVNDTYKSHLSIEAYAKRLSISSGQLTRLTKNILGMTALDVLNARLIFEAERDLTYTSDSIKQIAANLGFEDEAYFSRFFRKQTGQTPRTFRVEALRQASLSRNADP